MAVGEVPTRFQPRLAWPLGELVEPTRWLALVNVLARSEDLARLLDGAHLGSQEVPDDFLPCYTPGDRSNLRCLVPRTRITSGAGRGVCSSRTWSPCPCRTPCEACRRPGSRGGSPGSAGCWP